MHLKFLKVPTTFLFFAIIFSQNTIAQSSSVVVLQDPKFEQLLTEKRKINNSITITEGYKIQIYNGDGENARRELSKFKLEFDHLDATIIFNTPYYKVWVGSFKTKMDAHRHLKEIRKRFTTAIVIKPTK